MNNNKYRLKSKELRKNCNPALFKFQSTADLKPLNEIIGQERAFRSLDFGLDIAKPGYNIYLAGAFGTGKNALARKVLEQKAKDKPVPADWVYCYNFKQPDCPRALELSAGQGAQFKKDISTQMDKIIKHIIKAFESEEYEAKKNVILGVFVEETNNMYLHLDEEARSHGFTISRNQNGINSIPLKDGEALNQDDFMAMNETERVELMRRSSIIQEKLNEAFRQYKEMEKNIKQKIKELENETARIAAAPYFAILFEKYRLCKEIIAHLEDVQQDLLDNYEHFIIPDDNSPANLFRRMDRRSMLRRYQVNLVVDNSKLTCAPVIFENNPTYSKLFGQIEYEGEFGVLATDFSKIKAGTIHIANGGYLVLNVYDIIKNYYVWDALKRVLKNQEIVVENVTRMLGLTNTETLQPQAIPANIKVILLGEPKYYYLLYSWDEEFQKLFKIRADFDVEIDKNRKNTQQYAQLISSVCEREQLRHFSPEAVAGLIDYGSRMADDQNKITTMFAKMVEIIYEADCWAKYDKAEIVGVNHVKKALQEKKYRSSMMEDKILDYIKQDTIMINIEGDRIGELNGLAVYEMGDHYFGKPVRITAKTFMGEKGLVNIEREIRMSGNIHSKGVLTLAGYMGFKYAQDKALSLTASLTFEQSYQGIEGDSASSAELYALLSSLAQIPIKQSIAVTGSVNQNGEIQAIGGVNQKIEGFYEVCKNKGLNGKQGVIIPKQNVSSLMLDEEIVDAVRNKKFSVWAIRHIDEGLEILTGIAAGEKDDNGRFPADSIHHMVDNKLREWSNKRKKSQGFVSSIAPGFKPGRRRKGQ
ncbi:MAG: ATP-binding protein [Syntrophomonadaceae bacterium]|nr:ATP-binding protein [Syntrophomonadaceae bacterium]MDD3024113.1 ATP-binding protein [Syntrophomonadaceae bacterium]